MTKTAIYIGAIVLLLIANLFMWFSDDLMKNRENGSLYFDRSQGEDIQRIEISFDSQHVSLERSSDSWRLNKEFKADQGFVNTLISVLERVETGRKIVDFPGKILGKVQIEYGNNEQLSIDFASNGMRTKSYFVKDGVGVEVAVPGYRDNVIDIFMLHPDQWRDRLVFDGSWRTIQKLTIDQTEKDPVEIRFDDQFFLVNGINPVDSSMVVDYLNLYQYFEANEIISKGRFPAFDSLAVTNPMATITIEDIKVENEVKLQIFPALTGQAYHLVKYQDNHLVIDARRVQSLLPGPELFLNEK